MNFPNNLLYTKDHEWATFNPKTNIATIGITDFAQDQLGDIVYVDITALNQTLPKEAIFGAVEAVKTVADLFMPISGTIIEINPELELQPELLNTDPYTVGWIIKIKAENPQEINDLMNAEKYQQHIGL